MNATLARDVQGRVEVQSEGKFGKHSQTNQLIAVIETIIEAEDVNDDTMISLYIVLSRLSSVEFNISEMIVY